MSQYLSIEELEVQHGELLPGREAMSLLNIGVVNATNTATATNVLTDDSAAVAVADQDIVLIQG